MSSLMQLIDIHIDIHCTMFRVDAAENPSRPVAEVFSSPMILFTMLLPIMLCGTFSAGIRLSVQTNLREVSRHPRLACWI